MFELRLSGKVDLGIMSAVGADKEMGLGAAFTLSCPPKKSEHFCGPMCRRCKRGHVFVWERSPLQGGPSIGKDPGRRTGRGGAPIFVAFRILFDSSDSDLEPVSA